MLYIGRMTTFKGWCKKFINDDTPFGDVAREIKRGKCIPNFKKKEQVLNFVKQTWDSEAVSVIDEMLNLYDEEIIQPYYEGIRESIKEYYRS